MPFASAGLAGFAASWWRRSERVAMVPATTTQIILGIVLVALAALFVGAAAYTLSTDNVAQANDCWSAF